MATTEDRPTLLMIGSGEPMRAGLEDALERHATFAEASDADTPVTSVLAAAPDLVMLLGDAAKSHEKIVAKLRENPLTATVPVALLSTGGLGIQLAAARSGVSIIRRSASLDEMARTIARLARELPERPAVSSGAVEPASLNELLDIVRTELQSGILSVSQEGGGQAARFVLRPGRNVDTAIRHFVQRIKPLLEEEKPLIYEFDEPGRGKLGVLFDDEDAGGATEIFGERRILLVEDDAAAADALAQELRAHGATVAVCTSAGGGLERARTLDPEVILVDEASLHGASYALLRQIRSDLGLRWASVLVARMANVLPPGEAPRMDLLAASLGPLLAADDETRRLASRETQFEIRLETLGPSRLLHALASSPHTLDIRVRHPRAIVHVAVAEGIVAGARAHLGEGTILEGSGALSTLLALGSGRVSVGRGEAPKVANLLMPVGDALLAAAAEPPPIAVSVPPPRGGGTRSTTPPSGALIGEMKLLLGKLKDRGELPADIVAQTEAALSGMAPTAKIATHPLRHAAPRQASAQASMDEVASAHSSQRAATAERHPPGAHPSVAEAREVAPTLAPPSEEEAQDRSARATSSPAHVAQTTGAAPEFAASTRAPAPSARQQVAAGARAEESEAKRKRSSTPESREPAKARLPTPASTHPAPKKPLSRKRRAAAGRAGNASPAPATPGQGAKDSGASKDARASRHSGAKTRRTESPGARPAPESPVARPQVQADPSVESAPARRAPPVGRASLASPTKGAVPYGGASVAKESEAGPTTRSTFQRKRTMMGVPAPKFAVQPPSDATQRAARIRHKGTAAAGDPSADIHFRRAPVSAKEADGDVASDRAEKLLPTHAEMSARDPVRGEARASALREKAPSPAERASLYDVIAEAERDVPPEDAGFTDNSADEPTIRRDVLSVAAAHRPSASLSPGDAQEEVAEVVRAPAEGAHPRIADARDEDAAENERHPTVQPTASAEDTDAQARPALDGDAGPPPRDAGPPPLPPPDVAASMAAAAVHPMGLGPLEEDDEPDDPLAALVGDDGIADTAAASDLRGPSGLLAAPSPVPEPLAESVENPFRSPRSRRALLWGGAAASVALLFGAVLVLSGALETPRLEASAPSEIGPVPPETALPARGSAPDESIAEPGASAPTEVAEAGERSQGIPEASLRGRGEGSHSESGEGSADDATDATEGDGSANGEGDLSADGEAADTGLEDVAEDGDSPAEDELGDDELGDDDSPRSRRERVNIAIRRANFQRSRGRLGVAERFYQQALQLNRRSGRALAGLARLELERGRGAPAVRYAQRLVRIRPRSAANRVLLGDALRRAGRGSAATRAYRSALEVSPRYAPARQRLGM